jgi:ABC-2 type transport system ATP-binding protein
MRISGLTRRFREKIALDDITLNVTRGSVFGLVGENGAGKTTLIKHILGLLKAQQGTVRVFGLDPVTDPVGVLGRIGYLSEESDLPGWMTIDELVSYMRAFYKGWDDAYARKLITDFEIDRKAIVKELSKGQRARVGLLTALAYRPDLLLLDEPSAGLDPIVRREILAAVIRMIADEGRTVVFSSHLLSEVERVSDYVTMLKSGRVILSDTLDNVKAGHRKVTFRFDVAMESPPSSDLVLHWEGSGREWTAFCNADRGRVATTAAALGAVIVAEESASLDDIFVARVGAMEGSSR